MLAIFGIVARPEHKNADMAMQCAGRYQRPRVAGESQRIGTQLLEVGNSSFAVAIILLRFAMPESTAKYLQRDFSKNEKLFLHIDNISKLKN